MRSHRSCLLALATGLLSVGSAACQDVSKLVLTLNSSVIARDKSSAGNISNVEVNVFVDGSIQYTVHEPVPDGLWIPMHLAFDTQELDPTQKIRVELLGFEKLGDDSDLPAIRQRWGFTPPQDSVMELSASLSYPCRILDPNAPNDDGLSCEDGVMVDENLPPLRRRPPMEDTLPPTSVKNCFPKDGRFVTIPVPDPNDCTIKIDDPTVLGDATKLGELILGAVTIDGWGYPAPTGERIAMLSIPRLARAIDLPKPSGGGPVVVDLNSVSEVCEKLVTLQVKELYVRGAGPDCPSVDGPIVP